MEARQHRRRRISRSSRVVLNVQLARGPSWFCSPVVHGECVRAHPLTSNPTASIIREQQFEPKGPWRMVSEVSYWVSGLKLAEQDFCALRSDRSHASGGPRGVAPHGTAIIGSRKIVRHVPDREGSGW